MPSDREIRALVAALASPNPPPIIDKIFLRLPKGFDRAAQKKVHRAYAKLCDLGLRVFPFLIKRWDDFDRYCLTIDGGPAPENKRVGGVCRSIIFAHIQPYGSFPKGYGDPRGKPKRPSYPGESLRSQKAAKAWWEKNKHRTLYEMQRQALDWVIAEEAKRPEDFKDEERRYLQKLRKELIKSGKPIRPGRMHPITSSPR
jgi:hypothetical protein